MKKRSLFVATAMLLVAVLVATGATFAWFEAGKDANATIEMKVADGAKLEMNTAILQEKWTNELTTADLWEGTKTWVDYSTTDTTNFYTENYDDNGDLKTDDFSVVSYDNLVAVQIYFRSTVEGAVKMSNAKFNNALFPDVMGAARIAVKDSKGNLKMLALTGENEDVTYTEAIADDKGVKGNQKLSNLLVENTIVDMSVLDGGFYTGNATFYFWLEGTDDACTGINAVKAKDIAINFTCDFVQ